MSLNWESLPGESLPFRYSIQYGTTYALHGAKAGHICAIILLFSVTRRITHKCRLNFSPGAKRKDDREGAWASFTVNRAKFSFYQNRRNILRRGKILLALRSSKVLHLKRHNSWQYRYGSNYSLKFVLKGLNSVRIDETRCFGAAVIKYWYFKVENLSKLLQLWNNLLLLKI
jgi:hypothetical protein